MSEYRCKQILSSTAYVAFQDATAATPTILLKLSTPKLSTLKPSVFSIYSNNIEFKDMMSNALGHANIYHSKGTFKVEYEKYVTSMALPHNTNILRFWEVSFPSTIRNEANPHITAQED